MLVTSVTIFAETGGLPNHLTERDEIQYLCEWAIQTHVIRWRGKRLFPDTQTECKQTQGKQYERVDTFHDAHWRGMKLIIFVSRKCSLRSCILITTLVTPCVLTNYNYLDGFAYMSIKNGVLNLVDVYRVLLCYCFSLFHRDILHILNSMPRTSIMPFVFCPCNCTAFVLQSHGLYCYQWAMIGRLNYIHGLLWVDLYNVRFPCDGIW